MCSLNIGWSLDATQYMEILSPYQSALNYSMQLRLHNLQMLHSKFHLFYLATQCICVYELSFKQRNILVSSLLARISISMYSSQHFNLTLTRYGYISMPVFSLQKAQHNEWWPNPQTYKKDKVATSHGGIVPTEVIEIVSLSGNHENALCEILTHAP